MPARILPACLAALLLGACATNPEQWRDCADCPELVLIPSGEFVMGADGGEEGRPEGPPHEVRIERAFALGRYEVTQAQFAAFVAATGHEPAGHCRVWRDGEWRYDPASNWRDPGYGRAPLDDEPVACVSWLDATAYVRWLTEITGKPWRLPTEAEWEYAASAGTTTKWYWGDDETLACAYANVYDTSSAPVNGFSWAPVDCNDGYPRAAPVGRYEPNAFGLYDIIGNVWEWTQDCYVAPYPADVPVDGSALEVEGPCDRRTVRGGSWITRISRNSVTFRGRDPEPTVFSFFGFRVARDVD